MGRKIPPSIGLKEILARIDSAHSNGSSSRVGIVVLSGLGGQEKTQIALEYCYISKDAFKAVFWVDASSERSATQSFRAIYAKIREPGDFCDNDEKLEFVRAAVRMWNFRWLIVFDNYDAPDSFSLEDFIPHSSHGSVLITTRHKNVEALVEDDDAAIELLGLPEKEALQLFVVKRLGYHALAITQAGTYIKSLKLEFSAFESYFSSQRLEAILKYKIPMNKYTNSLNESERVTALNVFTKWGLSFNKLKAQQNFAALENLMTLFAFFDPADISEELFFDHASCQDDIYSVPEESKSQKYDDEELTLFKASGPFGNSF